MSQKWLFLPLLVVVMIGESMLLAAGAVDLVFRNAYLIIILMAFVAVVFAFASRNEFRSGRFIGICVGTAIACAFTAMVIAWGGISFSVGYWKGVALLSGVFLPFTTLVIAGATWLFWYDWDLEEFLVVPEKQCTFCKRHIPLRKFRYCPYCGTEQ